MPYRGLDVTASESARRAFRQAGGRGTPLTFVHGERVSGFQQQRLDRRLAARGFQRRN